MRFTLDILSPSATAIEAPKIYPAFPAAAAAVGLDYISLDLSVQEALGGSIVHPSSVTAKQVVDSIQLVIDCGNILGCIVSDAAAAARRRALSEQSSLDYLIERTILEGEMTTAPTFEVDFLAFTMRLDPSSMTAGQPERSKFSVDVAINLLGDQNEKFAAFLPALDAWLRGLAIELNVDPADIRLAANATVATPPLPPPSPPPFPPSLPPPSQPPPWPTAPSYAIDATAAFSAALTVQDDSVVTLGLGVGITAIILAVAAGAYCGLKQARAKKKGKMRTFPRQQDVNMSRESSEESNESGQSTISEPSRRRARLQIRSTSRSSRREEVAAGTPRWLQASPSCRSNSMARDRDPGNADDLVMSL